MSARGTGPMPASLAALAVFSERPSADSLSGLALIVGGIVVLTRRPGATADARAGAGLRYGLARGASEERRSQGGREPRRDAAKARQDAEPSGPRVSP